MVSLKSISKTYSNGLEALRNVDLDVQGGEIHALVGENGAGKSTLMKILFGLVTPTSGTIAINGREVVIRHPKHSIELGIGMVHQDLMLVPSLTVMENVVLGTEREFRNVFARIDRSRMKRTVQELMNSLGSSIDPLAIVEDLPIGTRQMVEILRVFHRKAQIIIFDEPTSLLSPVEVEEFLRFITELKKKDKTIIFITHRLKEAFSVSDRITILRQGVATRPYKINEISVEEVSQLMISEKIALQQPFAYHAHDNTILEVENVPLKHNLQRSVSFHVRSYEIVGIAGVQGNGQEELFDILVGRIRPTVGRILFQGKSLLGLTVSDRRKTGMSFIPSDRIRDGLALDRSVYDNCIMGHHKSLGTILLRKKLAMRLVSEISNEYKIKGGETPLQRVISLSGGNMQKIIVGREIATHPTLLVAFNPTSGVDIAAKALIHNAIRGLAMRGNSSLIISNDMDELFSLSNRILVMYKAKIVAEFEHPNYDTRTIGLYMTGIKEDATNVRESSPQNPL